MTGSNEATPQQIHDAGLGPGGWNNHLSPSNQERMLQAQVRADLMKQQAQSAASAFPAGTAPATQGYHGPVAPSKPFNWSPLRKLFKFLAWLALLALLLAVAWGIKPLWTGGASLGMGIAGVSDWTRTDAIDKFLPASIKKEAMDDQALAAADAHMDKWIDKDFDTREGIHARQLLVAGALYNPRFDDLGIKHLDRALMDTFVSVAEQDQTRYEDYPVLYLELVERDVNLFELRSRTQGLASSIPESARLQEMAEETRSWRYAVGAFLHALSRLSTHPPAEWSE